MSQFFSRKNKKGQGLVEYGLTLTMVSFMVTATIMAIGPELKTSFSNIITSLSGGLSVQDHVLIFGGTPVPTTTSAPSATPDGSSTPEPTSTEAPTSTPTIQPTATFTSTPVPTYTPTTPPSPTPTVYACTSGTGTASSKWKCKNTAASNSCDYYTYNSSTDQCTWY